MQGMKKVLRCLVANMRVKSIIRGCYIYYSSIRSTLSLTASFQISAICASMALLGSGSMIQIKGQVSLLCI